MSAACEQVQDFFAGELSAAEADAFGDHLAGCKRCQEELHELAQLGALEIDAAAQGTVVAMAWYRKPRMLLAAAFPLAVAAAVLLWWVDDRGDGRGDESGIVLARAETRRIEGRISYPGVAAYRPYDPERAGPSEPESVPLSALAKLENRGDFHGVAAGYLLLEEPERALTYLHRAEPGVEVTSDRALALLSQGEAERAVMVLGDVSNHPAAMWNRALAYRELGLSLAAASTFEKVAESREPGWSEEARARAEALRADVEPRIAAYKKLYRRGIAFARGKAEITAAELAAFPGLGRWFLYEAVRAAETRDRVVALADHARALDTVIGGSRLTDFVEGAAAADFEVRGPLARRYAEILDGNEPAGKNARAYLEALRRAGADDILFGALVALGPTYGRVAADDLPELLRLAKAADDPWFRLFAAEQMAQDALDHHHGDRAEATLLAAWKICEHTAVAYRCARIAQLLARTYLAQHRTSLGAKFAQHGWELARRSHDYWLELAALIHLAKSAEMRDDIAARALPVAKAYLTELSLRAPDDCTYQIYVHEIITMMLINRQQMDDATERHRALRRARAECGNKPLSLSGAFVDAHIFATAGTAEDVARLRSDLDAKRDAPSSTLGTKALIDHIEGRLLLSRKPDVGRKLLRRAIETASEAPASDLNARLASGYSFALLAMDAGRSGNYDETLALLAKEAGATLPRRCVVGVAIEAGWVAAVRGPDGTTSGQIGPRSSDAAIPETLVKRLAGCETVDVLARPPLHGTAGLLPSEMAWRYVTRRETAVVPTVRVPRRLVVTNTEPPAELGLPRLGFHRDTEAPDVWLRGVDATPARVLEAMTTATVIEIHAHGLVDLGVAESSFIALSPEPTGDFALTAADVRGQKLLGAPLVILGACHAARGAFNFHEPWSLPAAFIDAGARAVIASPAPIADVDAAAFFADVRERIRTGAEPAIALRDARQAWRDRPGATWVQKVLLFE